MGESEHTVVTAHDNAPADVPVVATDKVAARIDWRKLLVPTLFVMVLPTIAALLLDMWAGSLPMITIAAIIICFPLATFWVMKIALSEMDRVIAEVAPPLQPETESEKESRSVDELLPDVVSTVDTLVDGEVGNEIFPRA